MHLNYYSFMLYTLLCLLGSLIASIEWYVISRNEYLREYEFIQWRGGYATPKSRICWITDHDIVTKLCKHFYNIEAYVMYDHNVRNHKNVQINKKVLSELSVLQHNRICEYNFLTVATFQAKFLHIEKASTDVNTVQIYYRKYERTRTHSVFSQCISVKA